MDLFWEILGRYILTGIILWGVVLIMVLIRLVYKALTYDNGETAFSDFAEDADKHKKANKLTMAIRYTLWPYGIVKFIDMYIKEENRVFKQ